MREPRIQFSRQYRDATEDDERCKNKHAAKNKNLSSDGAKRGVRELGQKRKKEQRDFGIRDVHDDPMAVEFCVTEGFFVDIMKRSGFGAKSMPRKIEQVAGSEHLEQEEREGGCLNDRGHAKCHGKSVDHESRA